MDVLLSTEITPDMVVSTNAPERLPGEVEWDADGPSSSGWPAGSIVTRTATRRAYRAAFDVPAGSVPPEENIAVAQLPYWQDLRPMNQWAMFDKVVKSQTVGPSANLVVKVKPGAITDLWLGNLDNTTAAHVVVRDKTDGVIVYDERRELADKVTTAWDWCFAPFNLLRDVQFTGIPAYRNCEVTITLETGGVAAIGMAAIGTTERWGCTEWNVNAAFQRYSPGRSSQAWGPVQQGGVITKDVTYRIFVKPADAPRVDRSAKRAMNLLAVFVPHGDPRFAGIRIFGEMISADMGYPGPNYVPLDITVREFL